MSDDFNVWDDVFNTHDIDGDGLTDEYDDGLTDGYDDGLDDEDDDGLPDEYDDYEGADMTQDLNEGEEVFRVPDMSGQDDIDIKDIMMRGDIDEHSGHVTPEYYESGTMSKTAEEDSAPDELPSKSYNGE